MRTSSRVMAASASHASTNPAMAHARRAGWIAWRHPRLSHAEPRRASAHRDAPTKTWDDDSFLERYVSSSRRLTHVSRARSNAPARSGAPNQPQRAQRVRDAAQADGFVRAAHVQNRPRAHTKRGSLEPTVCVFCFRHTSSYPRARHRALQLARRAEQLFFLRRLGVVGVFQKSLVFVSRARSRTWSSSSPPSRPRARPRRRRRAPRAPAWTSAGPRARAASSGARPPWTSPRARLPAPPRRRRPARAVGVGRCARSSAGGTTPRPSRPPRWTARGSASASRPPPCRRVGSARRASPAPPRRYTPARPLRMVSGSDARLEPCYASSRNDTACGAGKEDRGGAPGHRTTTVATTSAGERRVGGMGASVARARARGVASDLAMPKALSPRIST